MSDSSKRIKTSKRFLLYYWPLPFRGNFAKNLFAYTNTDYEEASMSDLLELKKAPISEQPRPFMAPPMLYDAEKDLFLAQMPAVCFYLGSELGLMPTNTVDQALTLKILGDCTDVLEEITCSCGAQMWTKEKWESFSKERFVRWLTIFEQTAIRQKVTDTQGFLFQTETATVADLAVHALFATMDRCLPQLSSTLRTNCPTIMALCDRLSAHKGIKALVEKQRAAHGITYCGGQIEKSIRSMLE